MRGFRQICCKHKVLTEAVGIIVELAEGCPIYSSIIISVTSLQSEGVFISLAKLLLRK